MTECPYCKKRPVEVCLADPMGCKQSAAAQVHLPQILLMNGALYIVVLETNPEVIDQFPNIKPVQLSELGYKIVERHQNRQCSTADKPACPLCYLRAVMQKVDGEPPFIVGEKDNEHAKVEQRVPETARNLLDAGSKPEGTGDHGATPDNGGCRNG